MALDTASVQQPGFNVDFSPTPGQDRIINGPSGIGQIGKSVVDVLQKRHDELKDSYENMNMMIEDVDARDHLEFLKMIEGNRDKLSEVGRKGVNNLDYIALKSKIMGELAAKKKQSETFSSDLIEARKIISSDNYIKSDEANKRLMELSKKPLSQRDGNEIQNLLLDPNIYRPDMMLRDSIDKTFGKEDVEDSYAYQKGGNIYTGTVSHSPLMKIKKGPNNEPIIGPNGEIEFEFDITEDKLSAIMANTKNPTVVQRYLNLAYSDNKLKDAGAGDLTIAEFTKNNWASLAGQVINPPRHKAANIKQATAPGFVSAQKSQQDDINTQSIADAIKNKLAPDLASMIGGSNVQFVSDSDNKYLVKNIYTGIKELRSKGKPDEKFSGLYFIEGGKAHSIEYNPDRPELLAATLYDKYKANFNAVKNSKPSKSTEKKSIADIVREKAAAAKNKK